MDEIQVRSTLNKLNNFRLTKEIDQQLIILSIQKIIYASDTQQSKKSIDH